MISYFKKNKLLSILIFITFISFILGILFFFLIDQSYKEIISNNIELLLQNKLIDIKPFVSNKLFSHFFIWIIGISVIGFIIILILYLYKSFLFSFELISLVFNLNRNNIIKIIAYLFPNLLFLSIMFILCYYSARYSILLFSCLFGGKKYNLHLMMKKYVKVFLFTFFGTILCCLLEYFILKYITMIKL